MPLFEFPGKNWVLGYLNRERISEVDSRGRDEPGMSSLSLKGKGKKRRDDMSANK
jgi:hypothetical protein